MPVHEHHLLAALPEPDRLHLLAQCEPVQLGASQVLCKVGQVTRHAYFPIDCTVSSRIRLDEHHGLAIAMVGSEGMVGAQLALGVVVDPLETRVQGAGAAWRVDAGVLRREISRSPSLQLQLLRYVAVMMDQRAVAAACLRFHEIEPRLSRWLLMRQDRAHAAQFAVTQEALAAMLGVRRVGVTAAAGALQRRGLIAYHRGRLSVLDRAGLEAASCSCYAADEQLYGRGMGPPCVALARHRTDVDAPG